MQIQHSSARGFSLIEVVIATSVLSVGLLGAAAVRSLRSNIISEGLITSGLVSEESAIGIFLKEHLAHAHVLIYGVLVVVVILFMPEGVLGYVRKMTSKKRGGEA